MFEYTLRRRVKMKRLVYVMVVLLLSLSLVVGCSSNADPSGAAESASTDKTFKIGYNIWVGSAGVFVADAKDYFKDRGVQVELVQFAGPTEAAQALVANQVDLAITTLDTLVMMKGSEQADNPLQVVHAIDVSSGADGIVAKADIKQMSDLKGKQVAVTLGAVNHFLLVHALETVGLSDSDVKLVNMSPEVTGSTFMAGKVDAAVTWEPFLSEAQANGGTLLFSTADAPGLVVDVLAASESTVTQYADAINAMIDAIDQGVADFNQGEVDTLEIVADVIGSKPEEVKDIATGLELFTRESARVLLVDNIGETEASIISISRFLAEQGLAKSEIDPKAVVNPILLK
jgi:NitT/TauT family transport system substrate-binding protein